METIGRRADSKVAEVYLSTLKDLGVTISLPKSLVSDVGGAEFAKKFRCKNLTVDLPPLSIRNLANSHTIHGVYSLCHLYKIQRFSTLCRLYGIGYRLLCKLNHTKSSTVLRLKAIWLKAKLPFELWLGQCCPVDPYLKGRLIWKLQQAFRPKDLVVPPTSTYKSETFEYLD